MNYYRITLVSIAALGIIGLLVLMMLDSSDTAVPEQQITQAPPPQPRSVVTSPVVQPATEETPLERLPEPMPEPMPEPVEETVVPEPQPRIAQSPPEPAPPPLPTLNESDRFVQEQLAAFDNGMALLRQLAAQEVVRKVVMMTENISRGIFPYRDLPVIGPTGEIQVQEVGEGQYVMDPASYNRFDRLVDTLSSVDTESAVNLYIRMKPLFRQAYAELGLPNRDFDEVLLSAIDNVLRARTFQGPFQLEQPNVMYRFADPELENLNDVEKLLLRMGPDNSGKLNRKLMAFKQALLTSR